VCAIKVSGDGDECAAPVSNRNFNSMTRQNLQKFVEFGPSEYFSAIDVTAGEWMRTVNLRRSDQLSVVDGVKMLGVKTVRGIREPVTVRDVRENFARRKIVRIGSEKKRQWKQGLRSVEKEDVTVTFLSGITDLTGKCRNRIRPGDMIADSIGAVFPIMEWTLNGLADDCSATKIRSHVGTIGGHDAYLSGPGFERHQLPAENPFGHRFRQLIGPTKKIPRGRVRWKLMDRGRRRNGTRRFGGILFRIAVVHCANLLFNAKPTLNAATVDQGILDYKA